MLRALQTRVAKFGPDNIVIYEATNGLSENSYRLAYDQGVAVGRREEDSGWLPRRSLLALLIEKNLEIMHEQRLATSSSGKLKLDTVRLDTELRTDYTNLVEASEKIAKVVAAVTFAPRLRAEQSPAEQKEAAVTSLYYMPYMTIDDLITGFAHYNQVIREVAKIHQTLLIAGEDTILADAQHYRDSVHFYRCGQRRDGQSGRSSANLIPVPSGARGGQVCTNRH